MLSCVFSPEEQIVVLIPDAGGDLQTVNSMPLALPEHWQVMTGSLCAKH